VGAEFIDPDELVRDSETAGSAKSPGRSAEVRRRQYLAAVLLPLIVLAIGVGLWTRHDFNSVTKEIEREAASAAQLYEEHIRLSLGEIDAALLQGADLVGDVGLQEMRTEAAWRRLQSITRLLPLSGALFVYDVRGDTVASSASFPPTASNVADRDYFQKLMAGEDGLYVGRVLRGRTVHKLFFPVARSIKDASGQIIAVVQAGVDSVLVSALLPPGQAGAGIYRADDGALIIRKPMAITLDETIAAAPFFKALTRDGATEWVGWTGAGSEVMTSARRVPGLPVLATASFDGQLALNGARERFFWRLFALFAVACLQAILMRMVLRSHRRERGALAKLAESEARFHSVYAQAHTGIAIVDWPGYFEHCNAAYEALIGYPEFELRQIHFSTLIHPDDGGAEIERARRLRLGEIEAFESEGRYIHKSGRAVWVRKFVSTLADRSGKQARVLVLAVDVTEQKLAEERVKLLLQEVNHRSKNILGVVQAIATQTAAAEPKDFLAGFSERLCALAANQDLLVKSKWRGVGLEILIRAQLAHLSGCVGDRITLDGPALAIGAAAAQTLSMVFHELATNAVKYGALSNATGRVAISWRLDGAAGAGERLSLCWSESGGPHVAAPMRQGFGATVIAKIPRMQLDADVELDYAPAGVTWRLACPAENALETAGADAPAATPAAMLNHI
jgi:PAS domain S-box-containing protein